MNNPWTNAYDHPNFVGYTKEQIDAWLDKYWKGRRKLH